MCRTYFLSCTYVEMNTHVVHSAKTSFFGFGLGAGYPECILGCCRSSPFKMHKVCYGTVIVANSLVCMTQFLFPVKFN